MTKKPEKDPAKIQEMFGKIAAKYDLTNSFMSAHLHTLWNKKLTKSIDPNVHTLLDLCSGTGEIAYRWLKKSTSPKHAICLDVTEEMLDEARAKSLPYELKGHSLRFLQADAASIPLENHSVDGTTVAYGVRNIQDLKACFSEVHRVLKPSGSFSILELTEPKNLFLRTFHKFYLSYVLPIIGTLVTRQKEAYTYLASSIKEFQKPEEIKKSLHDAGFQQVTITPLSFGIATLIKAKK